MKCVFRPFAIWKVLKDSADMLYMIVNEEHSGNKCHFLHTCIYLLKQKVYFRHAVTASPLCLSCLSIHATFQVASLAHEISNISLDIIILAQ